MADCCFRDLAELACASHREGADLERCQVRRRDGNDHGMRYDRRNTIIMEGGRKQFRLLDDLPGHYDYLRGLEVGFWIEHRPDLLELMVPELKVDGVIYQVPVLQFEYSRDTEIRYFAP